MPTSYEPSVTATPAARPGRDSGNWVTYRDRMIGAGQMTAAVRWAGLATPLDRGPGVFVVADRFCDDEQVVDIGHAHDLRAHFADANRIAGWHDRTFGQVVIYTIPNTVSLGDHSAHVGVIDSIRTNRFTDRS